jgi:DNA-binding beta-propeller fold protein YncE
MSLQHLGYIDLPPHAGKGGFDHAATHRGDGRLYVAHTANDAVDIIDCVADRYLYSISGLTGIAGVLTAEERKLVFTSNRGEDTVGIFRINDGNELTKVKVGHRPNGLAHDPVRNILLAANVGDPTIPGSTTASLVDVEANSMVASVLMPGRTRWAVFADQQNAFFINIADPPSIVAIDAGSPTKIAKLFNIPAAGPHGLDLDAQAQKLYCACDAKKLVCLDVRSGRTCAEVELNGAPDAIFFNAELAHLYVTIGDPGLIDVVDTNQMKVIASVCTEPGAHTIGFDAGQSKVYAFLPATHRASIYRDQG